jgi:hypothetical protein
MPTEYEDYAALFERYRKHFTEALSALPVEALNWRPPVTGGDEGVVTNTPAAIATHVAGAQRYWIGEVLGGLPAERDRDAEFRAAPEDASQVVAMVNAAAERVRVVLAGRMPEDLEQFVEYVGETITQRRLIVRMLNHTAEHWGELMLVRQMWEATA